MAGRRTQKTEDGIQKDENGRLKVTDDRQNSNFVTQISKKQRDERWKP